MPWAAAIALGAIVAPPDAAAATAVLKQLRPPHRLLVILEGESLFNDASALLVYRLAVGATVDRRPLRLERGADAARRHGRQRRARAGAVARRCSSSIARIHDVATAVVVQFCGTFARLDARRAAAPLGHHHDGGLRDGGLAPRAPESIPARIRIPSYAVWEVAVFVLNVLAFILVGFQLKSIVGAARPRGRGEYAGVAAAVCAGGDPGAHRVGDRRGGVQPVALPPARRRHAGPDDAVALSPRGAAVVGWCGMRGTVTLAAALALPTAAGRAFPIAT